MITSFITGVVEAIIDARQEKARQQVAQLLWHTEYKNYETPEYVAELLKEGKI